MNFQPNEDMLREAAKVLAGRNNLFWLIGGSGSGKSTIARLLSERTQWPIYDLDEMVFDRWMGRYTPDRHPASTNWFTAEDSLGYALSLSWPEFDSLYRAANIEYLSLMAEDENLPAGPLLVDGGITHPELLARAVNPSRIICLAVEPATSTQLWNEALERVEMKKAIINRSNGPALWQRFLEFNKLMSAQIESHSQAAGIQIIHRKVTQSPADTVQLIWKTWTTLFSSISARRSMR